MEDRSGLSAWDRNESSGNHFAERQQAVAQSLAQYRRIAQGSASAHWEATSTGHPRLHVHRDFRSGFLPDDRDIVVYLPPGYDDDPSRHYPVLYLHDGQNLFDPATAFGAGRTWQVSEAADAAIAAGEVEPLIIVGIYNTGDRRMAEYTPVADWRMGGGEAASYGLLLTRELMPWIAQHYRVRRDCASTGVGGSSLGGLVSLYLGLEYAHLFGRLAILSPSVWWGRRNILAFVHQRAEQMEERPRIWLDAGDREGRMTLRDAESLARRLRNEGWRDGETLHFERIDGGTHDEASWARRVRPFLRFLFPPPGHSAS
jgi:enterochelin esterase-like enzyme